MRDNDLNYKIDCLFNCLEDKRWIFFYRHFIFLYNWNFKQKITLISLLIYFENILCGKDTWKEAKAKIKKEVTNISSKNEINHKSFLKIINQIHNQGKKIKKEIKIDPFFYEGMLRAKLFSKLFQHLLKDFQKKRGKSLAESELKKKQKAQSKKF